ncbi:MAG TPA: T9SS type A sorting domain-containing protein, partial [Ignavibacteria bacterium]|nr:T9SS type A sorting domain-containing protein [Ignavibacteria bacterium]
IERCSKNSEGNFSSWEKIGFVKGAGTTSVENAYSYEDKKLNDGTYRFRIKQVDFNGNFEYFSPANNADLVVGMPVNFEMSQNYPNPSNPVSKIDYQLPFDAKVSIRVYDLTGQEVSVLVNGNIAAGFHTTEFRGSDLASGVYIYRIDAISTTGEKFAKTMKMVLVK